MPGRFLNKGNKSTKTGFGEGLLEAGTVNENIVVIGADITASVGAGPFAGTFPHRFLSLGIAEQNCAGVSAGLALSGKIPVFATYGVFSALRTTDQIRVSLSIIIYMLSSAVPMQVFPLAPMARPIRHWKISP